MSDRKPLKWLGLLSDAINSVQRLFSTITFPIPPVSVRPAAEPAPDCFLSFIIPVGAFFCARFSCQRSGIALPNPSGGVHKSP